MSNAAKRQEAKAKDDAKSRQDLPPPPWKWLSWLVFLLYIGVFTEAVRLFLRQRFSILDDDEDVSRVFRGLGVLSSIYLLEVIAAVGPGWCCMSPGWSQHDVLQHHLPFLACVSALFALGLPVLWVSAMRVVLFTALNEGLFIAASLGAPEWIGKVRRIFAFTVITILLIAETTCIFKNVAFHWARPGELHLVAFQNLGWLAAAYHGELLRVYIRRWQKNGTI